MTSFMFKVMHSGKKRKEVHVWRWRQKDDKPIFVGYSDRFFHVTAPHIGDYAVACQIISNKLGYRMKDSYSLLRKDIKIYEL